MALIDPFVSQHEGQARHLQLTSSRDKSSFHQNRKILVGTRLFLQHTLLQSLTSLSPMGILTFQHFNKGLFFSFGCCQGSLSVGNFLWLIRRTLFSVLYGSLTHPDVTLPGDPGGATWSSKSARPLKKKSCEKVQLRSCQLKALLAERWPLHTVSSPHDYHGLPWPFLGLVTLSSETLSRIRV